MEGFTTESVSGQLLVAAMTIRTIDNRPACRQLEEQEKNAMNDLSTVQASYTSDEQDQTT